MIDKKIESIDRNVGLVEKQEGSVEVGKFLIENFQKNHF